MGSNMPLGASASNFTSAAGGETEQPKKKTVWPGEEDDAPKPNTPAKTNNKQQAGNKVKKVYQYPITYCIVFSVT